jgi:hypothetical protein
MKTYRFPLIIFIAFLVMEISNVLYYFNLIPEQLVSIISTVIMSIIIASTLLFLGVAVGIALMYVIVAIICIAGNINFKA